MLFAFVVGGALLLGVVAFRYLSAEIYDMLIVSMTARWYAATLLKLESGMKVVDVGIGTATALVKNAELVRGKRLVVCGFDYEKAYVTKAQTVVQDANLAEQIHVCQADVHDPSLARTLGVQDGFFDAAYFSGSISLMPEPHKALQNVAKLLKPGGRIYITQTFQNRPSPIAERVKPLLRLLTSVDFGQLVYHSEVSAIIHRADMTIIEDEPIKGSINNASQTARVIVVQP